VIASEIPQKNLKGTYILICLLEKDQSLQIGSLGQTYLKKGIYAYVGSAFGPGGILARICRHVRRSKRIKWHIDYLTSLKDCFILGFFLFINNKIECNIAKILEEEKCETPIIKFGSTDCKCKTHLFKVKDINQIQQILSRHKIPFSYLQIDDIKRLCNF